MRPHTIILLLLLWALAVADPQPCTFLPSEGLHFDDATNTLTCSKNTSLMRIEYNSKKYVFLKCEEYERSHIWKYKDKKVVEASSTLNVTCIEYCATSHLEPRVKKLSIEHSTIRLECDDPRYGLWFNTTHYDSIKCKIGRGWGSDDGFEWTKIAKADEKPNVTCMEHCAITEPLSKFNTTYDDEDRVETLRISCPNSDEGLILNSKHYKSLECSRYSGWTTDYWRDRYDDEKHKIAESFEKQNVTCKKSPPLCATALQSDSLYFDKTTEAWKCSGEAAIEWNSKYYEQIFCDSSRGWGYNRYESLGEERSGEFIAESDVIFNATCAEYCVARGNVNKHEATYARYGVKCNDGDLFFNGTPVRGGYASCDPRKRWMAGYGEYEWEKESLRPSIEYLEAALPIQFECRPDPLTRLPSTTPATTTTIQSATGESLAEAQHTELVVVGSIVGIIILGIIICVIIVSVAKRRRPAHDKTNKNGADIKQAGQNTKSRDSGETLSKSKDVPSSK